jgi:O-antigen ligase
VSEPFQSPVVGRVWTIPAAILLLAGLFPPETRPESAIGCAILLALGAVVLWVGRLDGARALVALLATVSVGGLLLVADSPGLLLVIWSRVVLTIAAAWILFCLPKDLRAGSWLAAVLGIAGTVASLHAIHQKLWGLAAIAAAIRQGAAVPDAELILVRAEVGRAYASFATPAALGGYLVLALSVAAAAAFGARGSRRLVWLAVVAVQLAGLACTESVTAVLSALGAVGLAALAGRLPRRVAWVLLAVVAVGTAGIFLARGREVLDVGGKDTPWSLRARNFRVAVEMIEDHPMTGVGPGAFGERYPAYRRPGDNESQYAHNLPLQMAAELGVPLGAAVGLGFFVLFIGPVLRRSVESPALVRGIEIGLAAFALQNLADFTAYLPSVLWTAVMLRAAVARRDALAWSWPSRIPAVAAVVLTVAAAWVAIGSARGEHQDWQARLSMAAGDSADALRRSELAVRHAPWEADHWLALGQLRAAEESDDARAEALLAVSTAVRLVPHRAAARDLRGKLRFVAGDYPGAYADALDAARLYPMHGPYGDRLLEVERWLARGGR